MSYTTSALIMFAAGLGVPLLAAANAQFGQFIGSPIEEVVVMLFVSFLAILIIALVTSNLPISRIVETPKYLFRLPKLRGGIKARSKNTGKNKK